jgi:hypothetical protein
MAGGVRIRRKAGDDQDGVVARGESVPQVS